MNRREFLGNAGLIVTAAGAMDFDGTLWRYNPLHRRFDGTVFIYGRLSMDDQHLHANRNNLGTWLDAEYRGLRADFLRHVQDRTDGKQAWEFALGDLQMTAPDPHFYEAK